MSMIDLTCIDLFSVFVQFISFSLSSKHTNVLQYFKLNHISSQAAVIYLQFWAYGSLDSLFPISMSPSENL